MTDATQLTSEEIQQYREQFKDYPEALKALDTIEECEGYLTDSLTLILMRETSDEAVRSVSLRQLAEKCRTVICQDGKDDILELFNVVASFLPPPASQALTVTIYVTKIGTKKFCQAE